MHARITVVALAMSGILAMATTAFAEESKLSVGAIDAVLTVPPGVDHPPVALLIAGSGTTDHDGNGPQVKPGTLKKLSEQLVARKIATLRYDKRGAGGWKPEFGRPEDFRFKDFVDDSTALVNYLRGSGNYSKVIVIGHSEGGLVGILTARRIPIDRLVLLTTAARKQGDLVNPSLKRPFPPTCMRRLRKRSTPSWPGRWSIRRRPGLASQPQCNRASPRPSTKIRSSP